MMPDTNTQIINCIRELERLIPNPNLGIGTALFEYISTLTPMVNVDLLIFNEEGNILMSWREDNCGTGWHIPGGVIRYKESIQERIDVVIKGEIGIPLNVNPIPLEISEIITESDIRGHFITMIYQCRLSGIKPKTKEFPPYQPGNLKWHERYPSNMVKGQNEIYKKYFKTI